MYYTDVHSPKIYYVIIIIIIADTYGHRTLPGLAIYYVDKTVCNERADN